MGRQLQLATTSADEIQLLRFVNSVSPIRVFQTHAHSIDELWIRDWDVGEIPGASFCIWPEQFAWSPSYAQTGGPKCPPERANLYYIANTNAAPIFDFSRSFLEKRRYGRIYWARDFSAPQRLAYDERTFSRLTDSVWRWIRKVGHKTPSAGVCSPYFLPDAWLKHGAVAR